MAKDEPNSADLARYRKYYQALDDADKQLIRERDFLYGGSWAAFRKDLEARLHRRPFIFKHAANVETDLPRIDTLDQYERRFEINLADYAAP